MTSLAEQFFAAAAGKTPFSAAFAGQLAPQLPVQIPAQLRTQFDTQVDFFQSFTKQAFDSASRVVALNLATSRASVERSTRAAQALIASRDPREVLTLGGAAEEQMHSLFNYSRELMSIASSVQPYTLGVKAPAAAAQLAAPIEKAVEAVEAASAPAAPVHSAPAEPVVVAEPEQEPAVEQPAAEQPAVEQLVVEAEPAPVAGQTEIAMAAGQGEPQAGVAPHPASAPVPAEEASIQVQKVVPASSSSKRKK